MTARAAILQDEIDLPQILVDVIEPGARAKRGWLGCEIGSNVEFSMRDLESYCFAAWEPVVYDAMLVAAAVEYADKTQRRPALLWQRDITLRIPVHELQRWHDPQVIAALTEVLVLLTGDRWTIQFYARRKAETSPTQGHFALPANVKAVIPFSDGLDSCAVAGLSARTLGDTLVRVRLGTKGYEGRAAYVWENLGVTKFREGAARDFPKKKITSKLREYAIAGTLHLDHLAGLRASAANAGPLNLSAFQLGRSLGLSQDDARAKLDRLLCQHESEWKAFVQAQGPNAFIADWAVHAS